MTRSCILQEKRQTLGRLVSNNWLVIYLDHTHGIFAEKILMGDPHVGGAIMFGRSRFNVGVLISPKEQYAFDPKEEKKLAEFRALIW